METTYYIIVEGRQEGPFVREELKYHNLRPDTMVWRAGLENWVAASQLSELADLLASQPAEPVYPPYGQQPQQQYPPYGQQHQQQYPPYGQQPQQQYPPYGQFDQQYPPYGQQQRPYNNTPVPHTNWLPWAIVVTVLGCCGISMIFGIIGIVNANKANNFYAQGLVPEGEAANSSARTFTLIGAALVVLSFIAGIFMGITGTLSDLMSNM